MDEIYYGMLLMINAIFGHLQLLIIKQQILASKSHATQEEVATCSKLMTDFQSALIEIYQVMDLAIAKAEPGNFMPNKQDLHLMSLL